MQEATYGKLDSGYEFMNARNLWSQVRTGTLRAGGLPISSLMRDLAPKLVLPVILSVAFATYASTLTAWFQADDFWFLQASQTASSSWDYIVTALDFRDRGPFADPPTVFQPDSPNYRPFYTLSFFGLFQVLEIQAWGYHLWNIVMHISATVLVWLIARKITQRSLIAHGAALLFALHPAYALTVAWIANGNPLMANLASMAALWLFLKHLDGGRRHYLCYGGSLLLLTAALLTHPETIIIVVMIVLTYGLVYARTLREPPAVRTWLELTPFLLLAIASMGIQNWVRDESGILQNTYSFGPHMYDNILRFMALSVYPIDAEQGTEYSWQHAIASVGMLLATIGLLTSQRRQPYPALFIIIWFYLSLITLSVSPTVGAPGRKLYAAGPSLAMVLAMLAVAVWDARPQRFEALSQLTAAVLVLLLVLGLSVGASQAARKADQYSLSIKHLVDEFREAYPNQLPEDSRVFMAGVPWQLRTNRAQVRIAIQLYYGADVAVHAAWTEEELRARFPNMGTRETDVFFHCTDCNQIPLDLSGP